MQYRSTRGQRTCSFLESFLEGLAKDGGLFLPVSLPVFDETRIRSFAKMEFTELAFELLKVFVDGEIPDEDLLAIVTRSFATFQHEEVTPTQHVSHDLSILELFHGPTLAFKDVALQLIGNLYEYVAQKQQVAINILAATSGDTGAAAIYGVRGKKGISICVLYPYGKISPIQERQMLAVTDENVKTLAIEGNFDDCQRMVKQLFTDEKARDQLSLRAVNSINFVRIIVQMVYYFYAYGHSKQSDTLSGLSFSVPTGNFGNIFSAYLAKRMGLPIDRLIIATNANDILARFVATGIYQPHNFKTTYSPAMDIQVASNFERYLFYLYGEDSQRLTTLMDDFARSGKLVVDADVLRQVQQDFIAYSVDDATCLQTIQHVQKEHDYLLDPHTACAVAAFEKARQHDQVVTPILCLATAHPIKFPDAMQKVGAQAKEPDAIAHLHNLSYHVEPMAQDLAVLQDKLQSFFA